MHPSLCSNCGSCALGKVSPFHSFAPWGYSGNKGGEADVNTKNRAPQLTVQITVFLTLEQMTTCTAAAGRRRPERKLTDSYTGPSIEDSEGPQRAETLHC
jgi:hypothetical protein